ncbi:MAG: hypothetical protein U1F23_01545 [Lysobacterales bacterium]
MYTIDTATGFATAIGLIGPDGVNLGAMVIAVPSNPCSMPSDVPWLSEDASTGTTPPGGSSTVTVTMDATSLADGTYTGNVCVWSYDPIHPLIAVPVTFTVGGNDTVFENGFDGP